MRNLIIYLLFLTIATSYLYRAVNSDLVESSRAMEKFTDGNYEETYQLLKNLLQDEKHPVQEYLQPFMISGLATDDTTFVLDYFTNLISANPDDYELIRFIARLHREAGLFVKAIPLYEQVLEIRPVDREMRIQYARMLQWTGRYEESIEQYKRILGE